MPPLEDLEPTSGYRLPIGPEHISMVGTLLIILLVLAVGTIVWIETHDLLAKKSSAGTAGGHSSLPFLIVPIVTNGSTGASRVPRPDAPVEANRDLSPDTGPVGYGFSGTEANGAGAESTATVAFRRVVDEPVQLLPGRFAVIEGEPGRDEIRFMGALGERTEFMVGRVAGRSQHVVTLHSPTVSRRHAKMIFAGGRWAITNLSSTNPVLVNGEPLGKGERAPRLLDDGDRIELGEVVLRFQGR